MSNKKVSPEDFVCAQMLFLLSTDIWTSNKISVENLKSNVNKDLILHELKYLLVCTLALIIKNDMNNNQAKKLATHELKNYISLWSEEELMLNNKALKEKTNIYLAQLNLSQSDKKEYAIGKRFAQFCNSESNKEIISLGMNVYHNIYNIISLNLEKSTINIKDDE